MDRKKYIDTRNEELLINSLKKYLDIERLCTARMGGSETVKLYDEYPQYVEDRIKENSANLTHIMVHHIGQRLKGNNNEGLKTLVDFMITGGELKEYIESKGFSIKHDGETIIGIEYDGHQVPDELLISSRLKHRLAMSRELSEYEYHDSGVNGFLLPSGVVLTPDRYKSYPEILENFEIVAKAMGYTKKSENIISDYIQKRDRYVYTALIPIDKIWVDKLKYKSRVDKLKYNPRKDYICKECLLPIVNSTYKVISYRNQILCGDEGVDIPLEDIIEISDYDEFISKHSR